VFAETLNQMNECVDAVSGREVEVSCEGVFDVQPGTAKTCR